MASASEGEVSAADGQSRILTWSKASKALSPDNMFEMELVCEAGKRGMLSGVQDLLADASGGAVLCTKSCDSTPARVQHRTKVNIGGRTVWRSGKQGCDFLVKNQFARARISEREWAIKVLLQEATIWGMARPPLPFQLSTFAIGTACAGSAMPAALWSIMHSTDVASQLLRGI